MADGFVLTLGASRRHLRPTCVQENPWRDVIALVHARDESPNLSPCATTNQVPYSFLLNFIFCLQIHLKIHTHDLINNSISNYNLDKRSYEIISILFTESA